MARAEVFLWEVLVPHSFAHVVTNACVGQNFPDLMSSFRISMEFNKIVLLRLSHHFVKILFIKTAFHRQVTW